MTGLTILGGTGVEGNVLEIIGAVLAPLFRLSAVDYGAFEESEERYVWGRGQYDSAGLLKDLMKAGAASGRKILGVTALDLCTPILTFVFGQAQLGGTVAIVSMARLKQEYYHLEPDHGVFLSRVCKESVHELGHTFGLTHCPDRGCAMSLSTGIAEVDRKNVGLCASCRERVFEWRKQ